ncbi:RNA polymerase sigma factor [Seonamhaeicola marinus]|uniref:RNA polymerase sigma factor n=1 Tax=Seonamhaeicola marinus TaxID=1912246 RepID=A0A5D0JAV0_9FLAO|nr:RNA polymerase sigma factor [Seonamhaeicola marinus]TYA92240.1 RNA polymerase sigma factor [Seonamhaeicola marinus]
MATELHKDICKEKVFEGIYNRYIKDLQSFLFYKYGDVSNPEDIAQEAFVKLWGNCKSITASKAKSFLYTVANNLALNSVKHNKVVLKYKQKRPKHYTNESPEFLLEEEEFLKKYQRVLEDLKEEHRVAFLLSKVEGKKHSEIAELLGVTQKVVEYRIYTAFNTLKSELGEFRIK